ncbi:alcohol dehydrogenase [Marinithermofilum abyssi]|uniref:Alcohol dehydrogenase n=1 Tax=Marinithermofilum abyssi TaxID=1571185 RepID=A0A8J2YFC2_9BACL|nr:zinc-binding dehydrogenase [Marinithermofilum abyssi]GGE29266.1 alcohol dehydrogenase [Marinithermofilum abyssi]
MKAIVLREIGGPEKLRYEEVETPTPQAGEVLVKVKYAALNRRDVFITYGMYPGMKLPSILGADGAGEVVALESDVQGIAEGDEVIINPGLGWGAEESAPSREFHLLGMPVDGTYAQYIAVPAENIYPKPKHLTWEEAAALPLAGITAYRALITRGQVQEGETVLIPGIGSGVALYILQMAVTKGAKVYVTSSSEEKIERSKQLGAVGGVNYTSENWVKQLRGLIGGADLIVDGVGGPGFNDLISLTKIGGRIVTYGATNGPVPQYVLPKVFFKNMDIRGTTMGSPREFAQLLDLYERHQLRPVMDRSFHIEQATEAHQFMEKGRNFGKVTLVIGH